MLFHMFSVLKGYSFQLYIIHLLVILFLVAIYMRIQCSSNGDKQKLREKILSNTNATLQKDFYQE